MTAFKPKHDLSFERLCAADQAIDAGNHPRARFLLLGALAADPSNTPARARMAMFYFVERDYEAAADELLRVVDEDFTVFDALVDLAAAAACLGLWRLALKCYLDASVRNTYFDRDSAVWKAINAPTERESWLAVYRDRALPLTWRVAATQRIHFIDHGRLLGPGEEAPDYG